MSNSKYYFVGSFPPPYGGVTVKNALLYRELNKHFVLKRVDLENIKKGNIKQLFNLIFCLLGLYTPVIVCVGSRFRNVFTKVFYLVNKKKMRKSVIFIMGGMFPDSGLRTKEYSAYKMIFVETESMKERCNLLGLKNVDVYPNCRSREEITKIKVNDNNNLRVVYFSRVCEEKGIFNVLDAASVLKNVEFYVYGFISDDIFDLFFEKLKSFNNVKYMGVFDSAHNSPVKELSQYDLHVFPTSYKTEGVPGCLIESLLAGVPSIVSNVNYNIEIIQDDFAGKTLDSNTSKDLIEAINYFDSNRDVLFNRRLNAIKRSESFLIDNHIDRIKSILIN